MEPLVLRALKYNSRVKYNLRVRKFPHEKRSKIEQHLKIVLAVSFH